MAASSSKASTTTSPVSSLVVFTAFSLELLTVLESSKRPDEAKFRILASPGRFEDDDSAACGADSFNDGEDDPSSFNDGALAELVELESSKRPEDANCRTSGSPVRFEEDDSAAGGADSAFINGNGSVFGAAAALTEVESSKRPEDANCHTSGATDSAAGGAD